MSDNAKSEQQQRRDRLQREARELAKQKRAARLAQSAWRMAEATVVRRMEKLPSVEQMQEFGGTGESTVAEVARKKPKLRNQVVRAALDDARAWAESLDRAMNEGPRR